MCLSLPASPGRFLPVLLCLAVLPPLPPAAAASPPPDNAADDFGDYYRRLLMYHLRVAPQVPEGAVFFLGDSLTQGFHLPNVVPNGVNYGIGSDTTAGLLARIPRYNNLARASAIVVAIGVNDLKRQDDAVTARNLRNILAALPGSAPVIVNAILPVDARAREKFNGYTPRIHALNEGLRRLCETSPRLAYLDITPMLVDETGNLDARYHIGDGLHLSNPGYAIWARALRDELRRLSSAGNPQP